MTEQPATDGAPEAVWHALTPDAALERQAVTLEQGLTSAEADARRARYGPNRFAEAAKEPRWQAFLRQYKDPMQIVLLAAGVLSLFLLLFTDRRRLPLPLVVVGALVGGLILSDLTRAWGVVPVWGGLLLSALARNLRRRGNRPQV